MGTWDCAGRGMLWQVQELGAGACGTCEATQIVGERCLAGRLLLMAVQAVFRGAGTTCTMRWTGTYGLVHQTRRCWWRACQAYSTLYVAASPMRVKCAMHGRSCPASSAAGPQTARQLGRRGAAAWALG